MFATVRRLVLTSSTVRANNVGAPNGLDLLNAGMSHRHADACRVLLQRDSLRADFYVNPVLQEMVAEDPFRDILTQRKTVLEYAPRRQPKLV